MSSPNTTSGLDPWTVPAAPPPPGVIPNFEDPPTLKGITIGVVTTVMAMSTLLVGYSTVCRRKNLKLHDYTVILSMVIMYGFAGLVFALLPWARHQWDIQLALLDLRWEKLLLASEYFLGPIIFFAKLAILLMYLQLFSVMKGPRIAIWVGIIYNVVTTIPNFGITGALCSPAPGQPLTVQVNVKCSRTTIWGPIRGSLSVVGDIYLFILPIPILIGLNMKRRKRLALVAVFATVLLGIAADIVGLVYRVFLWKGTYSDVTWNTAVVYICLLVEVNIAIIVSVMPAVAGLAKTHFGEESAANHWWQSQKSRMSFLRTRRITTSSEKNTDNQDHNSSNIDLTSNPQRAGSEQSGPEGEATDVGVRPLSDTKLPPVATTLPRNGIVRSLEVEQTREYGWSLVDRQV